MATILCIDDQTYALAARVEWLRTHGQIVVVAHSSQAALEAFVTNPVDAALLDCHADCAALTARLLKRVRPGLPILMLASYCGLHCHLEGVVTACIDKAEAPTALLQTLQKFVQRDFGPAAA